MNTRSYRIAGWGLAVVLVAAIAFGLINGDGHEASVDSVQLTKHEMMGQAAPLEQIVDHTLLDELLRKYVDEQGMVYYSGLKQETEKLDQYLAALAQVNLAQATRSQKLAFYINAYNAGTLRMIVRHHGQIKGIKEINGKFNYHQWKTKEWKLAGETLSLDDIEHQKLRGELKEPRIHFAIVCASISCPALWNRAFSAKSVEQELDAAARCFVNSPKHVRTSIAKGVFGSQTPTLNVSKIFSWFKGDFQPSVAEFIGKYAAGDTAAFINQHAKSLNVKHLDYDWNLNERKKPVGG